MYSYAQYDCTPWLGWYIIMSEYNYDYYNVLYFLQ